MNKTKELSKNKFSLINDKYLIFLLIRFCKLNFKNLFKVLIIFQSIHLFSLIETTFYLFRVFIDNELQKPVLTRNQLSYGLDYWLDLNEPQPSIIAINVMP
jgi:hypothetical protein